MTATEMLAGSRAGPTDGSKSQRIRRFLVDAEPDAALLDPTLPQRGSPYPGSNPSDPFPLILDRYDVQAVGNGTHTWVDCIYTNDRSGRLSPHPDDTRPGFQTASIDFQDSQGEFPTVLTYPMRVPGEQGALALTRAGDTTIYRTEETRVVYEIQVVLQGFTNASEFAVIGQQNNRLHKIRGRYYRFKAGRIFQTEKAAWQTTYTWIEDTGTPPPLGFSGGTYTTTIQVGPPEDERILYLPPAGPNRLLTYDPAINDPNTYVRSPYHMVSFYMTAAMVPVWYQVLQHRIDANGWQSLPGNLNL